MEKRSNEEKPVSQSTGDDEFNPEDVKEALASLSEKKPETVTKIIMAMGLGLSGNPDPLYQKMNSDHVTQILDLSAK